MLIVELEKRKAEGNEENNNSKEKEVICLDMDGENDTTVYSDNEGITDLSGEENSYEKLEWSDIQLTGEFQTVIPASKREIKKALTTIGRKKITLADIENWKNKFWNKIPMMIKNENNSEYEVLKSIEKEIIKEKNDIIEIISNDGNESMTLNGKETTTNILEKESDEDRRKPNNTRVDNPNTNGESLPTKNTEWTVVGKGRGVK